ncbi:hypothetical protein VIGAN_06008000, partial [Vigna angularis var. angularis]
RPARRGRSSYQPFTADMWCATTVSFFVIGIVIWILEHRVNSDFRGPPKKQIVIMLMYAFVASYDNLLRPVY